MRPLLTAVCILILFACNRNVLKLESTNAKGEIPQLGNLVFRFSSPVVPDSILNTWDSTAYVKFKPAIPGRFRWEQPDQLVFSPAQPLPPATSFQAEVTDEVIAYGKFNNISGGDKIRFTTPRLKLEDINARWDLNQDSRTTPFARIDLYFNYALSPAALKEKLKVQLDGRDVPFDLITLSDNNTISVALRGLTTQDKDLQGRIAISGGLVPKGGSSGTAETIGADFQVASPFNLIVHDITSQHDGIAGTISVSTSQRVASADISGLLTIEPSVKYVVESTDEGFNIRSESFDADKSYLLTIREGLRGNIGGVLREERQDNIAFGELEPSVSFTNNKSVYLSSQGNRTIEMRIVNVPKVKVVISKIYETNLLASRTYGYEPQESERTDEAYYDGEYYGAAMAMGDVIYEKEIETSSLPKLGNSRLFTFNVDDRLPEFKGIYHIRVRSTQNYWIADSRFVSLSDIGLIAREGVDKLFVFANSIKTTDPVEAVNVVAYGSNNQVLGMGATNADGVAEISYSRKEFAGFKPAMIIAKSESDFNYLPLAHTKVNTSRFEVGGKKGNSTSLDAFIYPERDIYRPGETINFSVIIRDPAWKSPGEIPIKFRLLYPNGKEFRVFRKNLNEQGSAEGQVILPGSAITGSYVLEVYSSNDILIGSSLFNVEEFVPDRIKVSASLDRTTITPGSQTRLSINAVNFFGPPAAGRKYETEIQLKAKNFTSKKYSSFVFGLKNKGLELDKVVREGKLDESGNAEEDYEVPVMFSNNGLLQADFYTTVFDETGRPVSRIVTADVHTQNVFFGILEDGYWYYTLNQPVNFQMIALDKNQSIVHGAKAEVTVIKREYKTILTRTGGYFRYESQETDKVVSRQTITVGGEKTVFAFTPRSPGNYEIRVAVPGASSYVSRTFYSYGSFGGDPNSFEVNTDGNIDIETDRSAYNAGDKAKILFKCPFNGRLLVTVEQHKVLSYQYVDVANRTASIDLPLNAVHLPNVFITATLIKPHGVSDMPLTVAHGFQNVEIQEKNRKTNVEIIAAKTSRSNVTQQVSVKAQPGSYVTLAAVDNGVLQVTNFATPDPYGFFYASRALQVNAYDMYPLLFPERRARLSSSGGDGGIEMEKRVNPMPSKRVQIVSYWSGIVRANGSGEARFTLPVPRFSGQIRLMAVAYKNESFGSSEAVMTVADPVVVSMGLPRFLSPGDSVLVPVTITNTLKANTPATVRVTTQGSVKISGVGTRQLNLAANTESRVPFSLIASPAADTGRITVGVEAGGAKYIESIPIGVRPASPLLKVTASGSVAAGRGQNIPLPATNFLQQSARYTLVLSRNPVMQVAEQIRFLVQYPYGCTEQVISAAFPQLYYGDLAKQFHRGKGRLDNANQHVIEAIRQIKLRQLYNGALTLWDGEGSEHWWTTIYAAHFLIEARKAGFDVDDSLLGTMLNYINNRLRNKQTITYYYNRDQKKKIAPKEVAYSLYVLSLAARPNVSAMNYYKANIPMLSLDSRYMLSAAYAVSGDPTKSADILPTSFSGEVSVPETGGSFYSPIRDEAIALSSLIDVDPNNSQVPVMAKHVAEMLRDRRWYSTQECAFTFLALGKLARASGSSNVSADIIVNGETAKSFEGNEARYVYEEPVRTIQVNTKGAGKLYYFLEAEGISSTGEYNEEDSYIKVRRQFFNRFGKKIEAPKFKTNDLVIVQLSLERAFDTEVENIVITDMLPAGFEIENPRTKELPGMDWITDASVPTELDVRDDRINMFVDLRSKRQVYYYAVRAVSPGVFRMGPAAADAMYNGEYHSYHGAGTIRIND